MTRYIFIDKDSKLSIREAHGQYQPSGGQALLKVDYSGINPADIAHSLFLGLNDSVCGYEFCGTVIDRGPESRYDVGDVVFGSNNAHLNKPLYYGAHQDFAIAESDSMSMKLINNIPHAHAAALSVMVRTAADALLNHFGLPFSAIGHDSSIQPGAILIWGGASTVGSAAIQLAKALGVGPIFTTASASNHAELRRLGATDCFDYNDPHVVATIEESVKRTGQSLLYIFDTVCKPGKPGTIDLCESLPSSPNAKYACCIPQPGNAKWKMVLASRGRDFPVSVAGPLEARPDWEKRLEATVRWAMQEYGTSFRIPHVTVVKGGEEGVQAIQDVFTSKRRFQKVVIQHPI